jgi:hypothetical protein
MRISRLSALAVLATLALAPVANAMPQDQPTPSQSRRDLIQQDLSHLRAGGTTSSKDNAALAQEKYYSSYGRAVQLHHTVATADDSSPLPALGIGLGLIAVVAGSVAVAVRTRRRTFRVAV